MINQKKIGNETEQRFLDLLQEKGYWCHLFAYNKNGQPCDIIAIKDGKPFLIDVKHCDEKRFGFSNVRDNQRSCFNYYESCNNENCGFAIYFAKTGTWRWLSYECLDQFESYGFGGVSEQDCEALPL